MSEFRLNPIWRTALAAMVVAAGLGCAQARAGTTPISLGTAGNYGLLVGSGDALSLGGSFKETGDIGIGKSSTVTLSGSNTVTGTRYQDSGIVVSGSGTLTASGGTITQSMSQAISDATNASTSSAAMTGTAGMSYQNSSISVSGNSIVIKALTNLSENVLNISALSLTNGTITFDDNGYTGAKFIINVTGNFNITSSGGGKSIIQGINGATADDILFNVTGTGNAVSITGNSTNQIIGTILAPARAVTVGGGGTLTGAIIAGVNNAGKSYTVQSTSGGFNLNSFGYTYTPRSKVPEPSSIALFGIGAGALLAAARRRRSAIRP